MATPVNVAKFSGAIRGSIARLMRSIKEIELYDSSRKDLGLLDAPTVAALATVKTTMTAAASATVAKPK